MIKKIFILLTCVLCLSSVKISDIDPVKTQRPNDISNEKIIEAIQIAAKDREWIIKQINPNTFHAELKVRSHFLKTEIKIEKEIISMRYLDSKNLDYEDGTIHSKYANWTRNLMKSIQEAMTAPPLVKKEKAPEPKPVEEVDTFERFLALNDLYKIPDVEKALKRSATELNWVITSKGKNKFEGEFKIRDHFVKVSININKDRIAITHLDSKNLDFDGKTIHSKYFTWIENLLQKTKGNLK